MKLSFISTSKRLGSKLISHVKGDTCSNNTNSTNTGVCPDSSVRRVQTVSISNSCSTLTNEAADDDRRLTHTISISNSVSTKVDHCTMPPKTNVRRSRFSASSSASPRQLNNDSTQNLDYNIASSQSWSSEDDHVLFSSSLNELANDRNSLEEAPFTELAHCVSKEFTKHKGPSFRHSVTSTSKRLAQLCRQKTRQFKNLHTKLKQSVTGNSASSSRRSSTISNAGTATTVRTYPQILKHLIHYHNKKHHCNLQANAFLITVPLSLLKMRGNSITSVCDSPVLSIFRYPYHLMPHAHLCAKLFLSPKRHRRLNTSGPIAPII